MEAKQEPRKTIGGVRWAPVEWRDDAIREEAIRQAADAEGEARLFGYLEDERQVERFRRRLGGAIRFLALVWGLLFVVAGMMATLGLLLWPFSMQPGLCVAVGTVGVAVSMLGAWIITRDLSAH